LDKLHFGQKKGIPKRGSILAMDKYDDLVILVAHIGAANTIAGETLAPKLVVAIAISLLKEIDNALDEGAY
jgi:hypothetical protein